MQTANPRCYSSWWAELRKDVRLAMVPREHRDMIAELNPHVLIALVTGADPAWERGGARPSPAPRPARRRTGERGPEGGGIKDLHRLTLLHVYPGVVPGADLIAGGSGGDSATVQASLVGQHSGSPGQRWRKLPPGDRFG